MATDESEPTAAIPSFRKLREAVLAAEPRSGFPYDEGLTPERLTRLRAAPHLQALLGEIRDAAKKAHAEPIAALPFSLWRIYEAQGTRVEFEGPYFSRRGRLLALVLATVVDATDEHLAVLQDTLWAICDEYTWCLPSHPQEAQRLPAEERVDLFAAETAHALAETVTLLGSRLEKAVCERIRREIERRTFKPMFNDPVRYWWESTASNWAAVCGGAVGMAAMLLEKNRERLAGMLDRCCRAMESFLESYAEDGGCAEGVNYWQYGFGYYVYFAEMLHAFTSGRIDLLRGEKIKAIADFPAGMSFSAGNFANYSDGTMRVTLATGLVSRLAARVGATVPELLQVPSLHFDHCYRWPHTVRNLLWTDAALLNKPTPPGAVVLQNLGWVLDRRMINHTPVAFTARGGHNAEPHNQNDLGHFILHVGGESLLADLGAGPYTREYFGPQRYTIIYNSSEGHSVPLINGEAQRAGRQFEAKVLACETLPDGVDFRLDLTKAYPVETLRMLERTFRWRHQATRAQLVLTDRFDFSAPPSALQEVFISLTTPKLEAGRVTWQGPRGAVALSYDAAQFTPQTEQIPAHTHRHGEVTVNRLRLHAKQLAAQSEWKFTFDVSVK